MKSLFALAALVISTPSFACEIQLTKTELPIQANNPCLDTYFQTRNLGQFTLGEDERTGVPKIYRDYSDLSFGELLLFKLENNAPLGAAGRKAAVEKIYQSYMNNLRNDFGACTMQIFAAEKQIQFSDLIESARSIANQPGTRMMLTKDDVKNPSWKLICNDQSGKEVVEKSGNYFFFFVDVYENTTPQNLKDHLSNYLFSFR